MGVAVREMEVITENLGKDILYLREILRELEQNKGQMEDEIGELNRMWKGSANDMFVKQFQLDCVSFENLCRTIEEMIRAMEHAKMEYEKCDNKVCHLIQSIRI